LTKTWLTNGNASSGLHIGVRGKARPRSLFPRRAPQHLFRNRRVVTGIKSRDDRNLSWESAPQAFIPYSIQGFSPPHFLRQDVERIPTKSSAEVQRGSFAPFLPDSASGPPESSPTYEQLLPRASFRTVHALGILVHRAPSVGNRHLQRYGLHCFRCARKKSAFASPLAHPSSHFANHNLVGSNARPRRAPSRRRSNCVHVKTFCAAA